MRVAGFESPGAPIIRVVGVVVSAGMVVLTGYLLYEVVHGYLMAMDGRLPPNGTFGFRDRATRSSEAAWYASQRAGFTWLAIGAGPVLAASLVYAAVIAVKRRALWSDMYAVAMMALLWAGIVTVAAGVHAHSVASELQRHAYRSSAMTWANASACALCTTM